MLVAGNWKSNKSFNEAREFAHAFSQLPGAPKGVEVMIAPPAPYLAAMGADPLPFRLGSQNVSATGPGAQTGEFTCLLYTSPSPRDLSTSRMPSSA